MSGGCGRAESLGDDGWCLEECWDGAGISCRAIAVCIWRTVVGEANGGESSDYLAVCGDVNGLTSAVVPLTDSWSEPVAEEACDFSIDDIVDVCSWGNLFLSEGSSY